MFSNLFSKSSNIDFYEKWIKHQNIIKKGSLGVGLILVLIVAYISTISNNPYLKIEKNLLAQAKAYVSDNNIDSPENFYLTLMMLSDSGYYIDYDKDINCDVASGVYIVVNNNKYSYIPYLFCNKYQSKAIQNTVNKTSDLLELKGANPLIISEEEFVDPGYINKSDYEVEIEKEVSDSSNLFIVKYIIKDKGKLKASLERIVILNKISENDFNDTAFNNGFKLQLIGSQEVNIEYNQKYEELGATAIDYKDGDISNKIQLYGSVDTSKINRYTLTYTAINSSGVKLSVQRVVNVVKPEIKMPITYSLNTTSFTKKEVIIKVDVDSPHYSHTILPNMSISYAKRIDYKIVNNGSYTFKVYDKYGSYEEKIIKVNNIDRNAPVAMCSVEDKTVTVSAIDANGIAGYSYLDGSQYTPYLSSNQYTFNNYVNIVNVRIKDNAGNETSVNCQATIKILPVIQPTAAEKVKYKASSDSLVLNISYQDGYYLSRIWAKNPNLQTKKQLITGNSPKKPKAILEAAINKYKLKDKIVLGANASVGIRVGDAYGDIAAKYPIYNLKEPSSLLIYNGEVVINDYEIYAVRKTVLYYIDGNNQLKYLWPMKDKTALERKKVFMDIINSGTYNTFVFNTPLVSNYQPVKVGTDYNARRNGFCQVDNNNFILVVSNTKRWKRPDFAKFMASIGCKTAVNFDGGGSVALFYKESGTNTVKTLAGGGRTMNSVIYFTELD